MNLGKFNKSKIASDSVKISGTSNLGIGKHGSNTDTLNVSFKSDTKAALNPTTMPGGKYGMSNKGGASGDGPTPGFDGNGSGVKELNGAQGN